MIDKVKIGRRRRQKSDKPNPTDIHVGARVRLRRTLLGMSQEKLGDAIGLTFQQVQKYERGANRVGASRLYDLSRVLDVPVSFFFEDIAPGEDVAARPGGLAEAGEGYEADPMLDAGGTGLSQVATAAAPPRAPRSILDNLSRARATMGVSATGTSQIWAVILDRD